MRWWNGSSFMWNSHNMQRHFEKWILMEVSCQGTGSRDYGISICRIYKKRIYTELKLAIRICIWGSVLLMLFLMRFFLNRIVFIVISPFICHQMEFNHVSICLFFLPFSFKMTMSALYQAGREEHHSDALCSEDSGSQPCAEAAAQGFGHCSVRSTSQYVTFLFKMCNSCQNWLS